MTVLQRIRFTTSHPQDLSPELIEAFATLRQSLRASAFAGAVRCGFGACRACAAVTHVRNIWTGFDRLRKRCPNVALSTDIIVGFPGETDAEFDQTLELLRQVEYDEIYSFMYSPRPQTVSAKIYDDDVADDSQERRVCRKCKRLQREISLEEKPREHWQLEEILVDGQIETQERTGDGSHAHQSNRQFNGTRRLWSDLCYPFGLLGRLPIR